MLSVMPSSSAAVVLIRNGDLNVRRGCRTVGIPVGENVEPRVKRGHKAQTHDDDNCHNALAKALHIKVNYFTYLFHALSSDAALCPVLAGLILVLGAQLVYYLVYLIVGDGNPSCAVS